MKIKMQEVFVTQDGQEFIDRKKAELVEQRLKIRAVVEGFFHNDMALEDIADALIENKDAIYRAFA